MSEELQTDEAIQGSPEANKESPEANKESRVGLSFLTIFILALVVGLALMAWKGHETELGQKLADSNLYLNTFGNMHPLVLHLPIGIVFLTVVMEGLGWISFGKYRPVTTLALFLAVITGAIACVTGYVDMIADGYASVLEDGSLKITKDWGNHMWAGIIFVGVLALAFLARVWNSKKGGRNPAYAILLLASAGVMGFGAHIGGEEFHGPTGVEKIVQQILQGEEATTEAEEEEATSVITKAPEERLAYAEVIVPILQSRCLMCHAEDTKKKGGLLMDSWEHLLAGGSSMPEIPTFVAGDTKESYMVEVLFLDEDDDMFMPPPSKKREPMPEYEREIIKWWVGALPKGNKLEDKSLAEMGAPAEVIEAASKLVTPEELAAIAAEKEAAIKAVEDQRRREREALDSAMGTLKQDPELGNAVNFESQDSSHVTFTAVSLRKSMTDDHLKKLSPVAPALTELQIGATSVSEAALEEELPKMINLTKLNLSQTAVTDTGLEAVAALPNLKWLNLYDTAVTDEGVLKLKTLTKLEKLYLWNSKATPEGSEALKKELPNLEIIFGVN